MERRHGIRLPMKLKVKIDKKGLEKYHFIARDIGYGGLFIEDYTPKQSENGFLSLEVTPTEINSKKTYAMKAIIVHRSDCGAGIMWADHYSTVNTAVHEIMDLALHHH